MDSFFRRNDCSGCRSYFHTNDGCLSIISGNAEKQASV